MICIWLGKEIKLMQNKKAPESKVLFKTSGSFIQENLSVAYCDWDDEASEVLLLRSVESARE